MKFHHLLALSIGLSIATLPSTAIAQSQSPTQAITAPSNKLPVPKLKPEVRGSRDVKSILQDEATWLKSAQYMERAEKLEGLLREWQALAVESYSDESNADRMNQKTAEYFAQMTQQFPNSGLAATLYASRHTNYEMDIAKIEQVYRPLIAKYPTHPTLLDAYRYTISHKYDFNIPDNLRTHLTSLYDRAIAQEPENLRLYRDRAEITPKNSALIIQAWNATETKLPNNPQVAVEFGRLIANSLISQKQPDPQILATAIEKLEKTIQQYPKTIDLYGLYGHLQARAGNFQKALPTLQAGLTKAADPVALNYFLGDFYLKIGSETQAMAHYQKVVQAKSSICNGDMKERFELLKDPAQQRAMLNLMIQSLTLDKGKACPLPLLEIGLEPKWRQQFSQDIITGVTPIALSSTDLEVHNLLVTLMQQQKQYERITAIGPKLLPADSLMLATDEYLMAEKIPLVIANAHEKLGNLEQSARFYELLGEYHKQTYAKSLTDRGLSYVASWHLGRVAWKQGKAEQAIALLKSVTTHRLSTWGAPMEDGSEVSYRALAHNLLGEISQAQGKTVEAKQEFEASIKADKEFKTPKDNLAKLK